MIEMIARRSACIRAVALYPVDEDPPVGGWRALMEKRTVRGISVATRCASVADFVTSYAERADEDSIFVGAAIDDNVRMIGTECAFAFLLDNEKPVLAGTCVVRDLHADASNPFRCQGLRLRILRLGPDSAMVFAAMRRVRSERAREFFAAESSNGAPVTLLDDARTQPVVAGARLERRRGRLIVAAAIALVVTSTLLQARPSSTAGRASASTWLGMPVAAPMTKPLESTSPTCK
jgi:hypothetical protein